MHWFTPNTVVEDKQTDRRMRDGEGGQGTGRTWKQKQKERKKWNTLLTRVSYRGTEVVATWLTTTGKEWCNLMLSPLLCYVVLCCVVLSLTLIKQHMCMVVCQSKCLFGNWFSGTWRNLGTYQPTKIPTYQPTDGYLSQGHTSGTVPTEHTGMSRAPLPQAVCTVLCTCGCCWHDVTGR